MTAVTATEGHSVSAGILEVLCTLEGQNVDKKIVRTRGCNEITKSGIIFFIRTAVITFSFCSNLRNAIQ